MYVCCCLLSRMKAFMLTSLRLAPSTIRSYGPKTARNRLSGALAMRTDTRSMVTMSLAGRAIPCNGR